MSESHLRRTVGRFTVVLIVLLSLIGCDGRLGPNESAEPATPFVVYVTATELAPGEVPPVGPSFGRPTLDPATVPTLDLSWVTGIPAPATEVAEVDPSQPTPSGPTLTPFVLPPQTIIPFTNTPAPGATALSPTATVTLPSTQIAEITPSSSGTLVLPSPPPSATPTRTPVPTFTTAPPTPTPIAPPSGALFSQRLGLNFISSAQHTTDPERFENGLETGVGWDRFAIYWNEIESQTDRYQWGVYDEAVRNDVVYGLNTNGILIGTPSQYYLPGAVPQGVYEPVFSDGTNTPGAGKTINPANPWAEFVYAAVNRYKPGGTLAEDEDWPTGAGVRVWEIWNEPDFSKFWQGTTEDYARLLKVGFLAARHADPNAEVMVGGLVLFERPTFFLDMLNIYRDDPDPVPGRYPFSLVAVHAYSHPYDTYDYVTQVRNWLAIYGLQDVRVWLNESGVPIWDDYPGPDWATQPDQIIWRASLDEQADYIVQNAAYAFMAGTQVLFHFQLYDDCGNQPAGTDFPPHDGSLCQGGALCWGDALGLISNEADNVCFSQHPNPGSIRPAYRAVQAVAELFGTEPFVPLTFFRTGPSGDHLRFLFARPQSSEIITITWSELGQTTQAEIPARAEEALLFGTDGMISPDEDGVYRITLDPATNTNHNNLLEVEYMIGGRPIVLIEQTDDPIVTVAPLRDFSATAFLVEWNASRRDLSSYEVWYRDESDPESEWQLWLEPDGAGSALFVGESGRRYSFFARAKNSDDEWTAELPFVQAWTITQ
ncbi:MAG: hypothetical protein GYB68_10695 [Chloroflexi bacterium]|nr:hypothetical protein [Chloroflexota bacterium]